MLNPGFFSSAKAGIKVMLDGQGADELLADILIIG
jgi:asparagine synthetase B (glutamine-hydrolysing)